MVLDIEAVYENGVLRPLTPVHLDEAETVHVRISTANERSGNHFGDFIKNDASRSSRFRPVPISGEPLSSTILNDRGAR